MSAELEALVATRRQNVREQEERLARARVLLQEAEHALRLSEDNSQTPAEVSIAGPTTTATASAGPTQPERGRDG